MVPMFIRTMELNSRWRDKKKQANKNSKIESMKVREKADRRTTVLPRMRKVCAWVCDYPGSLCFTQK